MSILKFFGQSSCKIGSFVFLKRETYIKSPVVKLIGLLIATLLTILIKYWRIDCVWRYFFGIPCPGCGMTRALLAAVHGDFGGMIKYNFMLPSVPIVLAYIMFDGRIFRSKLADTIVLTAIALGFAVHWFMLLANN